MSARFTRVRRLSAKLAVSLTTTRHDVGVTSGPGGELAGDGVVLVPVVEAHVPHLRRILLTEPVRSRWGDEAASPQWPFDDPSSTRYAVVLAGSVCGMVQYAEESEPGYRHASIDIFVDPAVHGRGVGRGAVRTLARHLVGDRGHHRLVIDPAADNEAAIRCYASVGFRPVGVMRRYERDVDGAGWHDGLLMDLLAEELDAPATAVDRTPAGPATTA
jgi:RimJ/RimL family protein N-acetyltransferase